MMMLNMKIKTMSLSFQLNSFTHEFNIPLNKWLPVQADGMFKGTITVPLHLMTN
jgi:hypothetical protein